MKIDFVFGVQGAHLKTAGSSTTSNAAVFALLRVAAAELPSLQVHNTQQSQYTCSHRSRVNPMGGSPGSELHGNSSFGLREAGGLIAAPRLQPMAAGLGALVCRK